MCPGATTLLFPALLLLFGAGTTEAYNNAYAPISDVCSNAAWRRNVVLRKEPSTDYDIVEWSWAQRKAYIGGYIVPASAAPIAFLALPVLLLLILLTWRLVRCTCCGLSARQVLRNPYDTLSSPWTTATKVLVLLFAAGSVALAIVGMVKLDRGLVEGVWERVDVASNYTARVADSVDVLEQKVSAMQPMLDRLDSLLQTEVNFTGTLALVQDLGEFLDAVPDPAAVLKDVVALDDFLASNLRQQLPLLEGQLTVILDQLIPSLPPIAGITSLLESVRAALSGYEVAVRAVAADTRANPGEASDVVQLLAAAQAAVTPAAWRTDLVNVMASLAELAAARDTSLLGTTAANAQALSDAASRAQNVLLPPLRAALGTVNALYVNRAATVMDELQTRFQRINSSIIMLDNMTLPAYELLVKSSDQLRLLYASKATSPAGLVKTLDNFVGDFNPPAGLDTLVREAASAQAEIDAASGVSDLDGYLARLTPNLALFAPVVEGLSTAIDRYRSLPSASTFTALRSTANAASAPVTLASTAVQSALPPFIGDIVALAAKVNGVVVQIELPLRAQLRQVQSVSATLAQYPGDLDRLVQPLRDLKGTFGTLPSPRSDILSDVQDQLLSLQTTSTNDIASVHHKVASAVSDLQSGSRDIRTQAVDNIVSRRAEWSVSVRQYERYRYPVWMGVYGLFILLALLLVLSASLSFPAGVTVSTCLALLGLVLYMVLAAVLSGGQVALRDACANVERVVMGQISPTADLYPLVQYYLYNTSSPDAVDQAAVASLAGGAAPGSAGLVHALAAAGYINITKVLQEVGDAESDVVDDLFGTYRVQPKLAAAVLTITEQLDIVRDQVADTLVQADYVQINNLYAFIKSWACCDVGNQAYIQWVAMTASGLLLWACCLAAVALMYRLDRLPRTSCCGCEVFRVRDFMPPSTGQFIRATQPFSQGDDMYRAPDHALLPLPPLAAKYAISSFLSSGSSGAAAPMAAIYAVGYPTDDLTGGASSSGGGGSDRDSGQARQVQMCLSHHQV